jgi:BirA family biotin operon repressor/biotin-[acetyl-CoA-carboxylase] ligase
VIEHEEHKSQARVFQVLRAHPGKHHSADEIAHKSGMRKAEVIHAVEQLQESGIDIDRGTQGYCLVSSPDSIVPAVIYCDLRTKILGSEIHSYKTVGSTNETARRLAEAGAREGTLVISEKQTRGRGRLGRSWHSPAGAGLYFSLILRPRLPIELLPALSQVAALSVCRAVEKEHNLHSLAQVKWPNDCLLGGRKAAGILVELSAELDKIDYAVVGIGINVNTERAAFPARLRRSATSVAAEIGRRADRAALLRAFLEDFERSYTNFQRYGLRSIGHELVRRSSVLGRRINVSVGRKRMIGVAVGIDDRGALRVKIGDRVETLSAGEVSLR